MLIKPEIILGLLKVRTLRLWKEFLEKAGRGEQHFSCVWISPANSSWASNALKQKCISWESTKHSNGLWRKRFFVVRKNTIIFSFPVSSKYIYIFMSIDYKSLIYPDPPPQHRTEERTCTGVRRALRDANTMASLVHVAQLHVKPPYFSADNTRKLWNTGQGLCMG